jgi:hypothetical protein
MARLVLIETAGNQDFIFATNKQKQNAGASELTYRIGTAFVLNAVAGEVPAYNGLARQLEEAMAAADYAKQLDEIARANPFGPTVPVEVLVATSGKAVLLVADCERGERIIEQVTRRALYEAPGAVVRGIVAKDAFDLDSADPSEAHKQMGNIHQDIERLRLDLPPPEARFPTLPILAPCQTSGLPAERREPDGEYLSISASLKREAAKAGWKRVRKALGDMGKKLPPNVEWLDDHMNLPWLAVVHADGNGFGKVFLGLDQHIPPQRRRTARDYCYFYRDLSLALELAGVRALYKALDALPLREVTIKGKTEELPPIVPLVLGGDDLTVVCDGSHAIAFAKAYLRAFERVTEAQCIYGFRSVIPTLVDPDNAGQPMRFGGAAGIAIVKPHHPFHRAYHLAEELTRSAKATKVNLQSDAVSAFDFHIVFDDAAADLEQLREFWTVEEKRVPREESAAVRQECQPSEDGKITQKTFVYGRPYIVSAAPRRRQAKRNHEWARLHHVAWLDTAIRALSARSGNAPPLPRSQQHVLRSALFERREIADARLALILPRYEIKWPVFGGPDTSLFFEEPAIGRNKAVRTRFLDALELIDIGESGAAAPETEGQTEDQGAAE